MYRSFLTSKMAVGTVFILTMAVVSAVVLPSAFNENENVTTDERQPLKRNLHDWLNKFLANDSVRKQITEAVDQQTGDQNDETTGDDSVEAATVVPPKKKKSGHSSGKLGLLKTILSAASSSSSSPSSDGKSSNLEKLFRILNPTANDEKNESTPSRSKLDRLLGLFGNRESSSNLQLALKLMKLAQGNGDLSSFSFTDMKSLLNFVRS